MKRYRSVNCNTCIYVLWVTTPLSYIPYTIKQSIVFKLGYLPPIFYVQMGNCWRENKNKHVLGFLSLLVEKKIFKKVRLLFTVPSGVINCIGFPFLSLFTKLRDIHSNSL